MTQKTLDNLIGQTLDDKYQIESELGKGGMGAVYLATHVGTERPVAVKVIAPEFMKNEEFVERFKREARAAGRIRHPNIVDVTDFGFAPIGDERVAYLVMEYLDGCTLAEVLAEETHLPLAWVIDIIEQACSAVDEAHNNGIVHRDLKPDNIWLEPNRRGGYTAKVLDFGIARVGGVRAAVIPDDDLSFAVDEASANLTFDEASQLEARTLIAPSSPAIKLSDDVGTLLLSPGAVEDHEDEKGTRLLGEGPVSRVPTGRTTNEDHPTTAGTSVGLTRVGSILGTPLYMSPEQCRGENADGRSDIYSLGVIAYQMLAGKTPFSGNMNEVMKGHIEQQPPSLDHKRVPKKVSKVLMSALAKNLNDRPASAIGFANELRAHSEGGVSLVRRALTMTAEQSQTFLPIALLVNIPVILLTVVGLVLEYLARMQVFGEITRVVIGVLLGLIRLGVSLFAAAVLMAIVTWLVTQLVAAPLRPIQIRPAFQVLRKRLRKVLPTTMAFNLATLIGLILCVIPAIYLLINYSLVTPVLMMEDVTGKAAFRRAKTLAKRSRRTVVFILFIQFVLPILATALIGFIVVTSLKAYNPAGIKANLFGVIYNILLIPTTIVLSVISAIITALLYWKLRQAGGETFREVVERLNEEEMPKTKWQRRMREKTRVTTRIGRSLP
jgi:serine/threonine protein kinase